MNSHVNKGIHFLINKAGLDIPYFTKGSFFGVIQQVIGSLAGLAESYLIGHYITKTVFGQYNLILSTMSMMVFLSLPGTDTALVRSVGHGYDLSLIQSIKSKIKFSIIGSFALVIISFYYFSIHESIVGTGILISAIFFPLLFSFSIFNSFLTAKKLFGPLALISSLSSIIYLSIRTASIFYFPTTIGFTSAYLVGVTIPAVIGFVYSLQFIRNKVTDPHLPSYGSFLTLVSVLPWISGNLGNIILGNMLGSEALAIFSVAYGFLIAVQKQFMVFYKPITAKLSSQSSTEHSVTLKRHYKKLLLIGFLLTFTMWLSVPLLIRFFFPTYHDSLYYGRILSLALFPLPLTWVINDMVILQKRKKTQLFLSTLPQVIKIILYFLLISRWQIMGLVLTILVDRYLSLILLFYVTIRNQRLK